MTTKIREKSNRFMILPKEYLSWSAYSTFKRSREEYIRHYFYGEPRDLDSKHIRFGRMFAEYMEKKKHHDDPVIDMVMKSIKKLRKREYFMRASLPSQWGKIPLVGHLDAYDDINHDFNEYKTGKRKWTASMAQKHGQLKFYALMLWLNHGVVDQKKNLVWIETSDEGGEVTPTGRIEIYPVTYTIEDLMTFGKELITAAHEISELYQQHVNQAIQ